MKYPKPIMRATELVKLGFPPEFLRKAYARGGIGWKTSAEKSNSPIVFDTQALEEYRIEVMNTDHKINIRR